VEVDSPSTVAVGISVVISWVDVVGIVGSLAVEGGHLAQIFTEKEGNEEKLLIDLLLTCLTLDDGAQERKRFSEWTFASDVVQLQSVQADAGQALQRQPNCLNIF
jgi:hypothetical protein